MKKKTGIIAILILILLLGVGYAAIANKNLIVNGSATVTPDDSNFVVKFDQQTAFTTNTTGAPAGATVTTTWTSDTQVGFTVGGLNKQGDVVVITYPILNESPTLGATLANPVISFDNSTYFSVTATLSTNTLAASTGTANLVVTITVLKTPVTDDETTTGTVTVTATPTNS